MTETARNAFISVLRAATRTNKEEIKALKKTGKEFYVIRYKNALYLSYNIDQIRDYLTSVYQLCANCKCCIAKPSEAGGCDKIFDTKCKHIYKYNFIRLGVEAFNTDSDHDFFSILSCRDYLPEPPRAKSNVCWHSKSFPPSRTESTSHAKKIQPTITIQWPY